jgi:hypothetical protein
MSLMSEYIDKRMSAKDMEAELLKLIGNTINLGPPIYSCTLVRLGSRYRTFH